MVKRKETDENWEKDELAVPIPIQIFLWRQSSPFIRPKLGKLHEATCLEIKEASKSLEKVLVQNILFGLSPSLTDAIRSVTRWRFVQAAFPHVMHCAATLLYNRRDSTITNLGAAETKLLYTLHWVLLDAAEECADADGEKAGKRKSPFYYLFSVTSIQVFVYLFAPLLHTLKESDFQNFRLENGLKIWNALWDFRHPDVPVFTTPVRPKRAVLRGKRVKRSNTQFGDVFLGSGKPVISDDDSVFCSGGFDGAGGRTGGSKQSLSSAHDPLGSVSSQDSRSIDSSKLEEEMRHIGGPREASFPETIPEETSSTEEEHVVIFRLGSYTDNDGFRESQVYKAEHLSSLLRPPVVEVSDVSGHTSTQVQSPSQPPSISGSTPTDSQSARPCGSPYKTGSFSGAGGRTSPLTDPTLATIMDVAVMRCLFVHQWTEEGVFWALTFIYRRMQEIGHEVSLKETPRRRSNSLPVPKIQISLHCDEPEQKPKEPDTSEPSSSEHNYATDSENSLRRWTDSESETLRTSPCKENIDEPPVSSGLPENIRRPLISRPSFLISKDNGKKASEDDQIIARPRRSQLWIDLKVLTFTAFGYKKHSLPQDIDVVESLPDSRRESDRTIGGSTRKKKKISELRAFVETKLRSRSEKALEKIGRDDSRRSSVSEEQGAEMSESIWRVHRPHSALEKLDGPRTTCGGPLSPFPLTQGLVKGKSMPSLRFVGSAHDAIDHKTQSIGDIGIDKKFLSTSTVPSSAVMPAASAVATTSAGAAAAITATVATTATITTTSSSVPSKVKRPIITVTQHTPSPSEYGWRDQLSQTGSIDSHQYHYFQAMHPFPTHRQPPVAAHEAQHPQAPSKPPLARSHTDSDIQYPCQETPDVPGTSHFVTRDGHINLKVLLKAAQSIAHRDVHICSLRVCELLLHLLDFLLDMGILKISIKLNKLEKMKLDSASTEDGEKKPPDVLESELKESNPVEAYMNTTMKVISHLGCPHGCGEGHRGPPADFLRHTSQALLSRICRSDQNGFRKYLRKFVAQRPLREVLDFFHAFLGFCVDPTSLLSPMSEWLARLQDTKRPGTGRVIDAQQGGYATNFGSSLGGAGSRGIEGQLVAGAFKGLVTRFVNSHASLKGPDNMAMYSDIRQLMCYVKEAHGGVFRRVVLSGLIDSADRPHKKTLTTQTNRIVRRVTLADDGIRESPHGDETEGKLRKSLFKKKGTAISVTSAMKKAPSISSVYDEPEESSHGQSPVATTRRRNKPMYSGRHAETDHLVPSSASRKRRVQRLVNWLRKTRVRRSDEITGIGSVMFAARQQPVPSGVRKTSGMAGGHPVRPRFVTKPGAGPLSQKLLQARKKVEDQIVKIAFGKNKKRDSNSDNSSDLSRRNSEDLSSSLREASVVLLRERKLVDCSAIKAGMQRFSFLLETCQPGAVPDAQLAGAILDLAIGTRLEEIFEEIGPMKEDFVCTVEDADVKIALRTKDDEEDFLDELNVNPGGSDCPIALRMVGVYVLLEITSFLRETYLILPKSGRMSVRERPGMWHGGGNLGVNMRDHHTRRWSTTLSSMCPAHASAQSLHSMGEGQIGGVERKISFALQEADNESVASSNATLTGLYIYEEDRRRFTQAGRGQFRKKSGGSFKRRSYKLKRAQKDPDSESMKRSDSIRSRRKVSAVSERSDTSDHQEPDVSAGEESPGVLSNEDLAESPADPETGEENITSHFPWLRVVTKLASCLNTSCTHQAYCQPYCYRRQMRACRRLVHGVRKVYGEEFEEEEIVVAQLADAVLKKDGKKQSRKTSEPGHGSPIKRKDSIARKDKLDKGVDLSAVLSRLGQQGSIMHLSKDTLEAESSKGGSKKEDLKAKEKKKEEHQHILKYLKTQVQGLFSAPFSLIIKAICVTSEDLIIEVLPVAWEMLLEDNNELAATAAVIFIQACVRIPSLANTIINGQLTHSDPSVRLNAILRFQVIWRSRYQAWARMEEGAHMTFKVQPHGIEFTLPSPKVGVETIPVVEPPWMPQVKLNVEEFTLDQSQHTRSFITANKTRRKIHAEMVRTALEAEEAKRRNERENFLLSAVPVTIQAAYEPSLHHVVSEEHEEGEENEIDTTGRPFSAHHVCVAQQLFPSSLCSSVLTIIHLLDDPAVTPDGVAVYQAAERVIWSCLVEDSALFLRFFLEKLTREKQDIMSRLIRRLVRFIPRLPSQAAFALFNYLVGYVMFYQRSPQEGAQEHAAAALSILWMVAPSVHGILFKDLKQIFRKEQCDAALLLTANIPSAKKIIVHGPGGADAGGIPSQFPIQEYTQFSQIHVEAVDFFGIAEEDAKYYFLVDHKTNQMHNMHSYVRDFYFFKRSQYPQLNLVRMEPEAAFEALQKQAFMLKFLEIGKVLLAYSVLRRPDQVTQRIFFLHEELTKLPSFPRKALEADFNLYKGGSMDKEIRGMDQLHKYIWTQLIARMFEGMACNLGYSTDLRIFISVINGALILHCEDSSMLRLCMATYINAATQFKNLFNTNGYMLIMPTILRVYSNYQSNKMVCKVTEMVVKQLYILHRKPFVLQMLGSVAPLLDTDETTIFGDANKIRGSRLFDLLHSLDRHHEDHIHILDLVTCEKPLRALDFCYHEESDNLSLLEVIDMCVTVIAYAADSRRGHQMLAILEAILAKTLQHFQKSTKRDFRQEKETIHHVAVAIKTLIINSEPLAKNYNGPQLSGMGGVEGWGSNRAQYTKASRTANPNIEPDEDSHSKYVSDGRRQPTIHQSEIEDPELLRQQFRQPRAMFLNIVSEFVHICIPRLIEINRKTGHETKQNELLDTKCHLRLAEVAHSLLKMAPYDPHTMGCQGLQRYMNEILPSPDWSHEDLRPALVNILRRLEKMFNKMAKKSAVRRITDWGAASSLLKGVYTTLSKHPYIAHLPHLKMLVQVCQSLVLGERLYEADTVPPSSVSSWTSVPPQEFCAVVVRIIAMQILALGVTYSLEQICGGSSLFPNSEKTENLIINLLLPMCLRVGCASRDSPRMRQVDISFAVTVVLHAMNPPLAKVAPAHPNPQAKSSQPARTAQPARSAQGADPRSQSWSHYYLDQKTVPKVKPALLKIAFLGLKVLVVCFDKQLSQDWNRILHCLRDMDARGEGGIAMWDFLDFAVSYRSPLCLQMRPFILQKLNRPGGNEAVMQYKSGIRDRLSGISMPAPVCKGILLRTLGHYLNLLRDELSSDKVSGDTLRPPSLEIQSEVTQILGRPKTSTAERPAGGSSPTPKSKEGAPPTASNSSEPRLYRKTFLLRKRASSASLRIGIKGEGHTGATTPTSPGEPSVSGDAGSGGSEEGASNKHRLQRHMAPSRKTFRFRKSRHGQSEVQRTSVLPESESQKSISHIDVEPSQVPSVAAPPSTSMEDSSIRQLYVPLIPEEEQGAKSPQYPSPPPSLSPQSQPAVTEAEGPSDISFMETSNISGYRESLDAGLKDLERLELQVRSGYYQRTSAAPHYSGKQPKAEDQSSVSETTSYRASPSGSSQVSRQSSVSRKRQPLHPQEMTPPRGPHHYEKTSSASYIYHSPPPHMVPSHQQATSLQSEVYHRQESYDESKYLYGRATPSRESYSSNISIIQTQQYRREVSESQVTAVEHDPAISRQQQYGRGSMEGHSTISPEERLSYSGVRPSSSAQVSSREPQFYDRGPNFRHSWTEGEEATHLHSYPRGDQGGATSKTTRGPARKTGVAGPRAIPTQRIISSEQYRGAGVGLSGAYFRQQESVEGIRKPSLDLESGRGQPRDHRSGEEGASSSEEVPTAIIISGSNLPEGTKRFVVDKFTVTFTEKDEEDTLI